MKRRPGKLLHQVRSAIRAKNYALRTERTYVSWVRRYILFHGKQHPREMSARHIEAFLTHLAVDLNVAASTQNQALSALLFLYLEVLRIELKDPLNSVRAKKPKRLPTVLSREEVQDILRFIPGVHQLMAKLLYGGGLRVMECTRLRVKDVVFPQHQLLIRDGKGHKDRVTILPDRLRQPLQDHLTRVHQLHQ